MEEPDPEKSASRSADVRWRWARIRAWFNLRDRWWELLNLLESNRTLRLRVYASALGAVLLIIAGVVLYPGWRAANAVEMARQWLAADKLEQAGPAVQQALDQASDRAEAWSLAADYAQRVGLMGTALTYARQASNLAPNDRELALDWASAALQANNEGEAEAALARVSDLGGTATGFSERLAGELARRQGDLMAARARFTAARDLEGSIPETEIPLGIVLVQSNDPAARQQGFELLERWADNELWGTEALRPLLEQAVVSGESSQMVEWAEAILRSARRQSADALNGLLALSRADPARFQANLDLEKAVAADDPGSATELISWLSGMGFGSDAISWGESLPAEWSRVPPTAVAMADAYRLAQDWSGLLDWTDGTVWNRLDFMRLAYRALALRNTGDATRSEAIWQVLVERAQREGGEGMFLAGAVYTWGWQTEAVELWEQAAQQSGVAISALGSLARHYQVHGDAEGLYRTFRDLYSRRGQDPGILNNHAYFSALVNGRVDPAVERTLDELMAQNPDNLDYRTTAAFVRLRDGNPAAALALLEPVATELAASPGQAFTYGLVLAGVGRNAEARTVLQQVDRATLNDRETSLLNAVLSP